jgi:hypothetical protein
MLLLDIKFGAVKDHGHTYKISVVYLLMKFSNMAIMRNYEVMLGQTLNHTVYIYVICAMLSV